MAERKATATWNGTLKEGDGVMRMSAWEGPYSFKSRFEEGDGTNPEELIAAAHAGCFSMAFAGDLERAGLNPEQVETTAKVELRPKDGAPTITKITLTTTARVPGADESAVREAAEGAKRNCPVSRALAGVDEVELDLTVET
jgi:osmotically inducible protein OsmC